MLDKFLIAQTRPCANKENLIFWKNYRITVLQDGLFRMERSQTKHYRDAATQSVWFRDMPPQAFSVTECEEKLIVQTARCKLVVTKERKDCRVELNGKLLEICNDGNLKGTCRTLDECDGNVRKWSVCRSGVDHEIEIGDGVCSLTGVAVFDDSNSLTLDEDGEVKPKQGDSTDEYVFVYGDDYRAAICALYTITGKTPLLPRFALGNWWSRYYVYTDKEYLRVLNYFDEEEIPLTVATIDMDWHWSTEMERDLHIKELGRDSEFYGGSNGWTGYSWNKRLFPDYVKFLKEIEKRGLQITLNVHPADGFRWWEDCYKDIAAALEVDAESGQQIKFDIADSKFINAYFSIGHKPYERDGVRFWWIDWQQGTKSTIDGLDPLWALNHYHYLDNASNHERALILSRYSGVGSHRYPLGFSGDTFMTWKTLAYLPEFTARSTNVGYTWWSHDIGGHMFGEKDDEAYLRHLQYGVFSPINRLHSTCGEMMRKEPRFYGNGAGEIAKKFLRLRHRLIPYLYTACYRNYAYGEALVEPLYYEWKNPEAYQYATEYRFGEQLLVLPITQKAQKDGFARVKAWLPQGVWTDIFTGEEYEVAKNGRKVTLLRELESIPVLIKAGGILPLSADKGNCVRNPKAMEILAYEGDGEYTLYEDGAEEKHNGKACTLFKMRNVCKQQCRQQVLTIRMNGDDGVLPEKRLLKIRFKNLPKDARIHLRVNGIRKPIKEVLTNCPALDIVFKNANIYEITVEYQPLSKCEKLIGYAREVLTCANLENKVKERAYNAIRAVKTVAEYKKAVKDAVIPTVIKKRLTEVL